MSGKKEKLKRRLEREKREKEIKEKEKSTGAIAFEKKSAISLVQYMQKLGKIKQAQSAAFVKKN